MKDVVIEKTEHIAEIYFHGVTNNAMKVLRRVLMKKGVWSQQPIIAGPLGEKS